MKLSATDIHIEPARDGVRVRLRVDGLLRNHQSLPGRMARAVVSRVKILAGLNIAERRLPQDGRARVRVGEAEADLRVATMPTIHGEAVVIRILVKEARALDLMRLGMGSRDLNVFAEQLAEPHGLIVVSGPTGSGKTTTLAAALSTLNHPERKIMTIEDPIEYQIPGIHQTQVKPSIDLTFATALRSFLRHDPDVMMVGELRDRETANIGIQAALTGHLVLTTLHTNSAADSIVRLVDLGVESFLLVSALRCIVGQRLVRKLCERCRMPTERLPTAAMALVDKGLVRAAGRRRHLRAAGLQLVRQDRISRPARHLRGAEARCGDAQPDPPQRRSRRDRSAGARRGHDDHAPGRAGEIQGRRHVGRRGSARDELKLVAKLAAGYWIEPVSIGSPVLGSMGLPVFGSIG